MKIAELRIHGSGKCFDLKFFEPTETITIDLENFLPIPLSDKLSSNATSIKDNVTTMIGFESRLKSVAENEELISYIEKFCTKYGYEYKQGILPCVTKEPLFEKAKV